MKVKLNSNEELQCGNNDQQSNNVQDVHCSLRYTASKSVFTPDVPHSLPGRWTKRRAVESNHYVLVVGTLLGRGKAITTNTTIVRPSIPPLAKHYDVIIPRIPVHLDGDGGE